MIFGVDDLQGPNPNFAKMLPGSSTVIACMFLIVHYMLCLIFCFTIGFLHQSIMKISSAE